MSLETFCNTNNIKLSNRYFNEYSETILELSEIGHDYILENEEHSDNNFLPEGNFLEYRIVFPSSTKTTNLEKKTFLINFIKELQTLQPLSSDITKNFGGSKMVTPYIRQNCIYVTHDYAVLIIYDKKQYNNPSIKYKSNFCIKPELEPENCNRYLMEIYVKRLVHHKKYIINILEQLIKIYS